MIDLDELISKIESHIETTEDAMDGFGVPLHVQRLIDDDIDLFKEIIINLKQIKKTNDGN